MCGVAAFVGDPNVVTAAIRDALPCLAHRGPDDRGTWTAEDGRVGLAHTRLAVLDTSDAARQPMASPSGRYLLAYNGEVYNHLDLRRELQGIGPARRWRGTGDTETLSAALDRWGLEATLRRCTGMFALAVWDREEQALLLARDRMGEKPLSYGQVGGTTFAVSDLRAIPPALRRSLAVDPVALAMLEEFDHVAGDRTILDGVRRVPPGTIVRIHEGSTTGRPYWSLLDVPSRRSGADPGAVITEASELVEAAVTSQRLSDVPLGVFLSGGIDSSLVTAVLHRVSGGGVRTFTIGFDDPGLDESAHAAAVARHLGTDHTEVRFGDDDVASVIPDLAAAFDEPLGDPSVLPTALLCRITRAHVTVALSGDGGDEVFGGYDQYRWHAALRRRRPLARALGPVVPLLGLAPGSIGQVGTRLAASLADDAALFRRLRGRPAGVWATPSPEVDDEWRARWDQVAGRFGPDEAPLAMDVGWYLPDDILMKVDRSAMGVSLETRAPLLDAAVVEFAFGLPSGYRTTRGSKWLLHELLARELPRDLFERPKRGFGAPLPRWLSGPLREWAEDLLADASAGRAEPWVARHAVRAAADDWRNGRDPGWRIWGLLRFLAWHESWVAEPARA